VIPHQRLRVEIRTVPWQRCLSLSHGKPVTRPTLSILVCSVFCWPIILAVGLGYPGYSTRCSGLASFRPAVLAIGCHSIQWWLFRYSLAYSKGNGVIGDLKYFLHQGVLVDPVGTISAILFSEFLLIFCATVCAIAIGGACERGRILPLISFIFVSTMIQCPS
jgi:ammonia channel protein AmtB